MDMVFMDILLGNWDDYIRQHSMYVELVHHNHFVQCTFSCGWEWSTRHFIMLHSIRLWNARRHKSDIRKNLDFFFAKKSENFVKNSERSIKGDRTPRPYIAHGMFINTNISDTAISIRKNVTFSNKVSINSLRRWELSVKVKCRPLKEKSKTP